MSAQKESISSTSSSDDDYSKNQSDDSIDEFYNNEKLRKLRGHYSLKSYVYDKELGYTRKGKSPEYGSPWLMRRYFTWMNPVIRQGKRAPLTRRDLPVLPETDEPKVVLDRFMGLWNAELDRNRGEDGCLKHAQPKKAKDGPADPLDYSNIHFRKTLFRFWAPELWYSVPLKLIYDILNYSQPIIMTFQITWVTKYQEGSWPLYYGYLATLAFALDCIIASIVLQAYFHNQYKIGMRTKNVLLQAVYGKVMNLASSSFVGRMDSEGFYFDESKPTISDGQIISIVSTDVNTVMNLHPYFHNYWSAPLQIVISVVLLYLNMGWAGLAGIPVLVLSMPATFYLSKAFGKAQKNMMIKKDGRLGVENEALQAMKIIKMYGWEDTVQSRAEAKRIFEMKAYKRMFFVGTIMGVMWNLVPVLVMTASFGVYVASGQDLTSQAAFTAISLFNMLRFPLTMLPSLINNGIQANYSVGRIKKLLLAPEYAPISVVNSSNESKVYNIELKKEKVETLNIVHFDQKVVLKDIKKSNICFKKKERTAIIGRIGVGKSSFIQALLGELRLVDGVFKAPPQTEKYNHLDLKKHQISTACLKMGGSIAYVPQSSWIMSTTLRENITLGSEFKPEWYKQVVRACQLTTDFKIMVDGDLTEIGEKGVNLSGGQKQRVALARAVYQDADIYIFDDVLSALDPHVGASIVSDVLLGLLKNRTLIMVTHAVSHLHIFDRVLFLDDNTVSYDGPFNSGLQSIPSYQSYVQEAEEEEEAAVDAATPTNIDDILSISMSKAATGTTARRPSNAVVMHTNTDGSTTALLAPPDQRGPSFSMDEDGIATSIVSSEAGNVVDEPPMRDETFLNKIVANTKSTRNQLREDILQVKSVSKSNYFYYFKAASYWLCCTVMTFHILENVFKSVASWWVGYWTEDPDMDESYGYALYITFSLLGSVSSFIGSLIYNVAAVRAGTFFHTSVLTRLLHAPMSFFDSVPTGRLLNIFSKEQSGVDYTFPSVMVSTSYMVFSVIFTLVMIAVGLPYFAIPLIPIMILYVYVQKLFIPASRQLKRIESQGSSPVISHFSATMDGCSSIRAYRSEEDFIADSQDKIFKALQSTYALNSSYRWLSSRLELVGAFIIVIASLIVCVSASSVSAGSVGLSLSYGISTSQMLSWCVRQLSELENAAVSIERQKEYIDLDEQEEPFVKEDSRPPANWPADGRIEFSNIYMRYKSDLPLILKGLNLEVRPGQKIGVVGRTGAGKSTLLSTLLRITPVEGGSIEVDGVDIKSIGLHDLRKAISIIPQEPIMFNGSLRYNLDPMDTANEAQLLITIKKSHLQKFFEDKCESSFDFTIEEGGKNLSAGEKQLICIARSLLRNSKILLLDEATSNVDPETDANIQKTIRTEFKDCTILTIAHRLNTILDYDEIVVIDSGIVAEKGPPQVLLSDTNSLFSSVAKALE